MKYCEFILHELSFNLNKINPCCCAYSEYAPTYIEIPPPFASLERKQEIQTKIDNLDLKAQQKILIKYLNEESNNSYCKGCLHKKEDESLSDKDLIVPSKYNTIYIRHWTECNSNCCYCDNNRNNTYGKEALYDPYNIIKKTYENNLIDSENLTVKVQGGDIGVLNNFEELIRLFEDNGFYKIHFSTNNIIYQPAIERILLQGKGSLNVSLDCGTKKTYEKIKRVDKFDECIKNLKKYLTAGINPDYISIHYILVQGFNCNKKEIKAFFNLMHKIGISTVGVRIDHKDLNKYLLNKTSIEIINQYKSAINYFCDLAKKYNLKLDNDVCIEQNFVLTKKENKKTNFFKKLFEKIFAIYRGESL